MHSTLSSNTKYSGRKVSQSIKILIFTSNCGPKFYRYSEKSLEQLSGVDFKELLNHFMVTQATHHEKRIDEKRRKFKLWEKETETS